MRLSLAALVVLSGCDCNPGGTATTPDTTGPTVTGTGTVQEKDASFRIMTWNIAFISEGDDINDGTWADDQARAEFVAQKLLDEVAEHDADIIVLNEAFNIEAQDTLSADLCGTWSNFVRYIDEVEDGTHQDAGLMIFSRHPFQNLNLTDSSFMSLDHLAFTGCVDDDADESDPLYWSDVGFILFPFSSCYAEDCLANKGVAAVRVTHQGIGDPINLLFSHLQASYGSDPTDEVDYQSGRLEQFCLMRDLVESIPNFAGERTFLLGDLNVEGEACSSSGCIAAINNGNEWTTHFGSGGFFGCGTATCNQNDSHFVDSWAFDMPPQDLGRTFTGQNGVLFTDDNEGHRLDYILHNVPSSREMCMQHMRVLRHYGDADGTQPSDHLPVWAEFNFRADHCEPNDAAVVINPDFGFQGTITYPSSVQWFVINTPGTYSLNVSTEVQYEVYAAKDMSYPIGDYYGETTDWGTVYKLPEPPYYVKVQAPDKTYTGPYSFDSHQHQCGPWDCCALTPADASGASVSWSTGDLTSGDRYFCFHTDVGETGRFPVLSFEQEAICVEPLIATLKAPDAQGLPDEVIVWGSYTLCDGVACDAGMVENDAFAEVTRLELGKYFVELKQENFQPYGLCWANLEFYTTLTYFYPSVLDCVDETGASGTAEEVGHDEIWRYLEVDDTCKPSTDTADFTYLYDFDEDDSVTKGLAGLGDHRFADCVVVSLLEEDDIASQDVTFLATTTPIDTLDPYVEASNTWHVWNAGDYEYRMSYRLTHEPE